jgi:hypothetical protein
MTRRGGGLTMFGTAYVIPLMALVSIFGVLVLLGLGVPF